MGKKKGKRDVVLIWRELRSDSHKYLKTNFDLKEKDGEEMSLLWV